MGSADSANKNVGCPVKYEFQRNNEFFFFSIICPRKCMPYWDIRIVKYYLLISEIQFQVGAVVSGNPSSEEGPWPLPSAVGVSLSLGHSPEGLGCINE